MKEIVNHSSVNCASQSAAPTIGFTKPRIESSSLFQGEREIGIVHQKEEYSLKITRNGKLILTK